MPSRNIRLMLLVLVIGATGAFLVGDVSVSYAVAINDALLVEVIWLQLVVILVQTVLWKKQQDIVEAQYEPYITAELRERSIWIANGTNNVAFNINVTRAVDDQNVPVPVDGTNVEAIYVDFIGGDRHPPDVVCKLSNETIERKPTIEMTYSSQNKKQMFAYIHVANKQGECQVEMTKRRRRL